MGRLGWILVAGLLAGAGPVDPDWPCIQRRQPALSVGQLWPGPPLGPEHEAHAKTPQIDGLAQRIAQRRMSLDEVEAEIAQSNLSPQDVGALFLAALDHIQNVRGRVMAGITRYAHQQSKLEGEIAESRGQMTQALAAEPVDHDAVDGLEAKLDWQMRIFTERQQSLTYVCESPVLLEQRAFALGRMLSKLM